MTAQQAVGLLVCLAAATPAAVPAQLPFTAACDVKPGNFLVNSGVLYLQTAATTKFEDQRAKALKDAARVLTQAVTSGGQEKNGAAWYWMGRYDLMAHDLVGADTALTKARTLVPKCEDDISLRRREAWVPLFNGGVQAWQAGKNDSAIASFRRANGIYQAEPMGLIYIANLFATTNQTDSAVKYFRLAVLAASDPKYAKERRDSFLNVALSYHGAQRYDEAQGAYREYLATYPGDVQALANLGSLYLKAGKRDSAMALYTQVADHADSADAEQLFVAAQVLVNAVPEAPDSSAVISRCATARKKRTPVLTPRQIAARCEPGAADSMRQFHAIADPQYRLAAKAYRAGLNKNPYAREALYNLAGISFLTGDSSPQLPLAQRLYAIDPLNKTTIAALVRAWGINGKKDSVLHYLQVADTLSAEVVVSTFTPTEKGATLSALVTNSRTKPSAPFTLTFEFLDPKGTVVATQAQDVPTVAPNAPQTVAVKVEWAGIVAWRYRR
ncbi:MAG TPA: tetratricopeptide repeat protein [Gemmatimonadales bacterium]|nr:tetratricopeptide repeat protein [Gemmatimonadales bacterium]